VREARYHLQRVDLYRARLYGGRALSLTRLEEFERASDDAGARLRQAREAASPTRPRGRARPTPAGHRSTGSEIS
jgi:hypothetical protein